MPQANKPTWWTAEDDERWQQVRDAVRQQWEQSERVFTQPDPAVDQDIDDTPAQSAAKPAQPLQGRPKFTDLEPAFRFGHAARRYYGQQSPEWDVDMERRLASEWGSLYPSGIGWDYYRNAVRAGWDYQDPESNKQAA